MVADGVRLVFGRRVRDLRQNLEWSQKELAARMNAAGFSWRQTTAAKVEAGERPVPVEEVAALAAIFNVRVENLFSEKRNPLTERLQALVVRRGSLLREVEAGKRRVEEIESELERVTIELGGLERLVGAVDRDHEAEITPTEAVSQAASLIRRLRLGERFAEREADPELDAALGAKYAGMLQDIGVDTLVGQEPDVER